MTTADDRQAIIDGYRTVFGENPELSVAQMLHAVAVLESGFGRAWKSPEGKLSKNLGAIQLATPKQLGLEKPYPPMTPKGDGFLYQDTRPKSDGTSVKYYVYFRFYETHAEAAADLARVVYKILGRDTAVLGPARRGDVYGFSSGMYTTGYYQGWGPTAKDRIGHHYDAMMGALHSLCRKLSEPLPGGTMPPPETLKRGAQGEMVKEWQRILGVVADGLFGPETERVTKEWQDQHGLVSDGIVGPKTWAAAEATTADDTEPSPASDEAEDIAIHLRGVLRSDVARVVRSLHEAVNE